MEVDKNDQGYSVLAELETFDPHEFHLISPTIGYCICGQAFTCHDLHGLPENDAQQVAAAYRKHV
jgi:hypothetical protein